MNQSLAITILDNDSYDHCPSDLLETMFINHKAHFTLSFQESTCTDQWHDTWVSLLVILCEGNHDQTTYMIDYYLPKLLKPSPDSLSYMIRILQVSADASLGKKINTVLVIIIFKSQKYDF